MKINDVELRADFYDANTMDKFQAAMKAVVDGAARIEADEAMGAGDQIREQCALIFECFDTIYGQGTSQAIFGDRTNLKECFSAFIQLQQESERQRRELQELSRRMHNKKKK